MVSPVIERNWFGRLCIETIFVIFHSSSNTVRLLFKVRIIDSKTCSHFAVLFCFEEMAQYRRQYWIKSFYTWHNSIGYTHTHQNHSFIVLCDNTIQAMFFAHSNSFRTLSKKNWFLKEKANRLKLIKYRVWCCNGTTQ